MYQRGSDYPVFVLVNKSSSQILATESLSLNLRSKPKKIPGTQIDGGGCLFRDALELGPTSRLPRSSDVGDLMVLLSSPRDLGDSSANAELAKALRMSRHQ